MKIRDIVISQIRHEETDFVPYTLDLDGDACAKLDKYYGSRDWWNKVIYPISHSEGMFDSWATMTSPDPSKPLYTIDAYGCRWYMGGAVQHLEVPGMYDPSTGELDVYGYKWPTIEAFLTPPKKARFMAEDYVRDFDKFTIVDIGAGHYELSWRLLGVEDGLAMTITDPEAYDYVIDNLDKLLNSYLDEVLKLPCDGVMLYDDWCDQRSCTMGPERWRKFLKPRLANIYKRIHDAGKFAINHCCGCVAPLIPDLIDIGLDVLETVQPEPAGMDPILLKQKYGDKIAFWGCLGNQSVITYGTPDELRAQIRMLRREMSRGGGIILGPCKPVNNVVPVENVVALYETFIEENYKFI